ncbi:MAG TPA: DUF2336 domain-containing protein [Devosiaceae bacterium]|nr:DUF2336 domain-containing protein [Devosiaceae bacterium]
MVAYQQFVELSQSGDSEARGQAAHLAALAYLAHTGPADEQAALYAALVGFLDDPSVKVRAALAYGLLHASAAPRPILLSLLHDSPVIARAVAQYSPALIDADLLSLVRSAEPSLLMAVAMRERISPRLAEALIGRGDRNVVLKLLGRTDVALSADALSRIAEDFGRGDAALRGALLARDDLPAPARLLLVEAVVSALSDFRLVKGAIQPERLKKLLRNASDTALTAIGEGTDGPPRAQYAARLIEDERISSRVMLHAIINGHVMFFADCLAELSEMSRAKVFTLLETGSRPALNALLARCGMSEGMRNLVARLVFLARTSDLAEDVAARHFVVTVLTEELIVEHQGDIPAELEEAFIYLSEQNVALARSAARGVMSAFAGEDVARPMPLLADEGPRLALPAA